jgi:TPP-dependent pyruvate/acetoin dehydrogenase alpha subunit
MGTALARHQSQPDIALKAVGYGVKSEAVDGMDVMAVEEATRKAVEFVRRSSEPYLIEYRTYRFRAHSMYDAELYRSKDEVEQWKARCPVTNFTALLRERGELTEADIASIEGAVAREIEEAVAFAEAGEWEPVEDLLKDVYTYDQNDLSRSSPIGAA